MWPFLPYGHSWTRCWRERDGPAAALEATAKAIAAMAEGELTPTEAAAVVALLESYRKAFETVEIERRLAALEAAK